MKPENKLALIGMAGAAVYLLNKAGTVQKLFWPLYSAVTGKFGQRIHPVTGLPDFHNGIDLRGKVGDKIKSPADGRVVSVYENSVGGRQLVIKHGNGYTTGYAHLNKVHVAVNTSVKQGQLIAEVGATGQLTGPHLHLTLKDAKGAYIDPEKYFV